MDGHDFGKISIVGVGNMGGAILDRLVGARVVSSDEVAVCVRNEERLAELIRKHNVRGSSDLMEACRGANIIILAVKPQQLREVLTQLKTSLAEETTKPLLISVAAGVTEKAIRTVIGDGFKIACVMPNLLLGHQLAAVGLYSSDSEASAKAAALFKHVAAVVVVEKQQHLDIVTAISASLPGLLALMLQSIIRGAVQKGLPKDKARDLVLRASAATAERLLSTGGSLSDFFDGVASAGGTTIHGQRALADQGFEGVLMAMVEATVRQAQQLSDDFEAAGAK